MTKKEKQERTNKALNEAERTQKETGISYGQQMARKWQREEKR